MPLLGMGGMGMGMGMGSPLLTGLMGGGVGYLLGRNSNQPADQQVQQVAPAYYPPPQAAAAPASNSDGGTLAQLKLLGDLHNSGVLTDAEFAREKDRLLGR